MKIITEGFARALNQLAVGRLGDDYQFAVSLDLVPLFLAHAARALNGHVIINGVRGDTLTDTDISIGVGGVDNDPDNEVVLFPSHPHSLGFFVVHLRNQFWSEV
jgi:hypothetical protein